MCNSKKRGIMFLAMGLLFVCVFLVGGWVLSSSNGWYLTAVFACALGVGLFVPGILICRSVISTNRTPQHGSRRCGYWEYAKFVFFFAPFVALGLLVSEIFIRSDFFVTSLGQHTFMIVMGLGLSPFFPLGIGWWLSSAQQESEPDCNVPG